MMFPFALISGYITEDFGQRLEVRILELEEDRAVFRTADRIRNRFPAGSLFL